MLMFGIFKRRKVDTEKGDKDIANDKKNEPVEEVKEEKYVI